MNFKTWVRYSIYNSDSLLYPQLTIELQDITVYLLYIDIIGTANVF